MRERESWDAGAEQWISLFSFMQGIMGNTIQQPPQLIDSANIRQEDAFDNNSDIVEDGGQTPYEATLQQGFQYPPTTEDLPPLPRMAAHRPSACTKLKPNTSRITSIPMGPWRLWCS